MGDASPHTGLARGVAQRTPHSAPLPCLRHHVGDQHRFQRRCVGPSPRRSSSDSDALHRERHADRQHLDVRQDAQPCSRNQPVRPMAASGDDRGGRIGDLSSKGSPSRRLRSGPIKRMVVSLGTSGSFGFRRLVERLVDIVPNDVEVLWQTGSTNVSRLGIESRASVPEAELASAIRDADAVVAHAGAGIALTILGAGKVPLLVPRLASRGEHVDDHQRQIADQMSLRGLAIASDVDGLTWDLVSRATEQQALQKAAAPRFRLDRHGNHTVAPRAMPDFDLSTGAVRRRAAACLAAVRTMIVRHAERSNVAGATSSYSASRAEITSGRLGQRIPSAGSSHRMPRPASGVKNSLIW